MTTMSFIPFILGVAAVIQGAINKQIAARLGLGQAILLNGLVLLTTALFLYLIIRLFPQHFPDVFRPRSLDPSIRTPLAWWFFVPGLCGFLLVAGIPFLLGEIGAFKVFIGLIVAQLIAGLLWDHWMEGIPINGLRIAGSVLALSGAVLTLMGFDQK